MLINVTGFEKWATHNKIEGYDFLCFEALIEACEATFSLKYPKMPKLVEVVFKKLDEAAGEYDRRILYGQEVSEVVHVLRINPSSFRSMKSMVKTLIHEFDHAVGDVNRATKSFYDRNQRWNDRPEEIRVVFEVKEVFGSVWSGFMERLGRGPRGNQRKHHNHLRRFVREPLPAVMKGFFW